MSHVRVLHASDVEDSYESDYCTVWLAITTCPEGEPYIIEVTLRQDGHDSAVRKEPVQIQVRKVHPTGTLKWSHVDWSIYPEEEDEDE